jgi:hypothetical protein
VIVHVGTIGNRYVFAHVVCGTHVKPTPKAGSFLSAAQGSLTPVPIGANKIAAHRSDRVTEGEGGKGRAEGGTTCACSDVRSCPYFSRNIRFSFFSRPAYSLARPGAMLMLAGLCRA